MKKDFVAFLGDKACTASTALTKGLRLQQVVSGHIPLSEDGGESEIRHFADTPREAAVAELLEEIAPHHKVIIWAVFRADYEVLRRTCKSLDLAYVEVHGDITSTKKQESVDLFNTDPKIRVLIGHPGSGGIGINLVASDYSIVFSRNFSLEQKLQSEARNYRGGSEIHEKVTQVDLVAEGTIDEVVLASLDSKESIAEKILSWKDSL
jgi:SNF2 family DNA or RNA helicase